MGRQSWHWDFSYFVVFFSSLFPLRNISITKINTQVRLTARPLTFSKKKLSILTFCKMKEKRKWKKKLENLEKKKTKKNFRNSQQFGDGWMSICLVFGSCLSFASILPFAARVLFIINNEKGKRGFLTKGPFLVFEKYISLISAF